MSCIIKESKIYSVTHTHTVQREWERGGRESERERERERAEEMNMERNCSNCMQSQIVFELMDNSLEKALLDIL